MVVRRSWLLVAASLMAIVLVAFGYWLWRPVPQLNSYIPTNSHLIIGFGSDFLHGELTDIGQLSFKSWRTELASYLQQQAAASLDQVERLIWTSDETDQHQTLIIQVQRQLTKDQQQALRVAVIGKATPVGSLVWKQISFAGAVVIITTDDSYQKPMQPNHLISGQQPEATYIVWDRPLPVSMISDNLLANLTTVSQQPSGQLVFDHHDSLYRLILRLPPSNAAVLAFVSLPPTEHLQLYVAGQKSELSELSQSALLSSWYDKLNNEVGQNYGLDLPSVLKSFGSTFTLLLDHEKWLTQSSSASLQQVASTISGYFRPVIKRGKLPDGSWYQELVRSEGQSATTTIAGQPVRVWTGDGEQRIYQAEQGDQSLLSNNETLITSGLTAQPAKGLWQACLPPEKLQWTNIVWLQPERSDANGSVALLPAPWQAVGLLSGQSNAAQEYIFCLL